MGKINNLSYKISNSVNAKFDKFFEGKNRPAITFIISFSISLLIVLGVSAILVFCALNWQKHTLSKNLMVLYISTFVGMLGLIGLIGSCKKYSKNRIRKTTDDIVKEEVREEMNNL